MNVRDLARQVVDKAVRAADLGMAPVMDQEANFQADQVVKKALNSKFVAISHSLDLSNILTPLIQYHALLRTHQILNYLVIKHTK